jgi:hypothetical protein
MGLTTGGEIMCEYCNGDHETQRPLDATPARFSGPVLTILKNGMLSVIGRQEDFFPIKYCPMCGKKLAERRFE